MTELHDAIMQFPVAAWLAKHTRVYDTGGRVIYADCPVCMTKKKLGVYRYNRVATCGRCRDGGHGAGVWRGSANLPSLVRLLEGCSWRDAFRLIHELAGLPETPYVPNRKGAQRIPQEAIPLIDCRDDERSVSMLRDRGLLHLRASAYLCATGRYRERVLFPAHYQDTYLGFEAKATFPSQTPKSLYSEMETDSTVYTLRGWDKDSKKVAITESVIDAESFHGLMNAVGCFGGFKEGQIKALIDLRVEDVYWFVDGDAYHKVARHLPITCSFFRNFVVNMPPDGDPNSIGRSGLADLLVNRREVQNELEFMSARFDWGFGL